MKNIVLLALAMSLFLFSCSTDKMPEELLSISGTLYKNANVITMESENIGENTDILVSEGEILWVGKGIPEGKNTVIDCTDKYIIPGLFDMHVHLWTQDVPPLLLANGITSVRNMSGSSFIPHLNSLLEKGRVAAPFSYTTSPIIDCVKVWPHSQVVANSEQAVKLVEGYVSYGYEYIKICSHLPNDILKAIFESANSLGVKVVGANAGDTSGLQLVDMGIYTLEHISSMPQDNKEVEAIAKSPVWFTPTQVAYEMIDYTLSNNGDFSKIASFEYASPAMRNEWAVIAQRYIAQGSGKEPVYGQKFTPYVVEFLKHSDRILAGTDLGNPGVIPGFSLHYELSHLVNTFGMSNFNALKAATVNGAMALGLEGQKGIIKTGAVADMVILTANPLENIANTQKIHSVVQGGVIYTRFHLDKMLEDAKHKN